MGDSMKKIICLLFVCCMMVSTSLFAFAEEKSIYEENAYVVQNPEDQYQPFAEYHYNLKNEYLVGQSIPIEMLLRNANLSQLNNIKCEIEYGSGVEYVPVSSMFAVHSNVNNNILEQFVVFKNVNHLNNKLVIEDVGSNMVNSAVMYKIIKKEAANIILKTYKDDVLIDTKEINLNVTGDGGSYKLNQISNNLFVGYTIHETKEKSTYESLKKIVDKMLGDGFVPQVDLEITDDIRLDSVGTIKFNNEFVKYQDLPGNRKSVSPEFVVYWKYEKIKILSDPLAEGQVMLKNLNTYYHIGESNEAYDSYSISALTDFEENYEFVNYNSDGSADTAIELEKNSTENSAVENRSESKNVPILPIAAPIIVLSASAAYFFRRTGIKDYAEFKEMRLEEFSGSEKSNPFFFVVSYIKNHQNTYIIGIDSEAENQKTLRKLRLKPVSNGSLVIDLTEDFNFSGFKIIRVRYPSKFMKKSNNVTFIYQFEESELSKDVFPTYFEFKNIKTLEMQKN